MILALGSTRAAKIEAVRAAAARIAEVDSRWHEPEIIALEVETSGPAMPLSDEELMRGARERAWVVRDLLGGQGKVANLFIGLEGGFHSVNALGAVETFLRGWAYATDGGRGAFGASPAILVPGPIVEQVVERGRELGDVIDEFAGQSDIRSRQGSWGVLSRDLLTRSMSFEMALVAALAPFYNNGVYYTS